MSLRRKAVIAIALAFGGLGAAVCVVLQTALMADFERLEDDLAHQHADRAAQAVAREQQELLGSHADWARWDDTAEFVTGRRPAYVAENMMDDSFLNLHVQIMMFVDLRGQVVYAKQHERGRGTVPLSAALQRDLRQVAGRPSPADREAGATLLNTPGGLWIVAAGPILGSDGQGPCRGALVLARRLDADLLARLAQLTQLELQLIRLGQPAGPDDQAALARLKPAEPNVVRPLSRQRIASYALLCDRDRRPAAVLRVTTDRPVVAQGRAVVRYLVMVLALMLLAAAALVSLLLWQAIIGPVARLELRVREIGEARDPSLRTTAESADEVGRLAAAINRMLGAIEEAQTRAHRAEARVRQAEKMESLAILAGGAAHDFNNLLLAILGNADLARLDTPPDSPAQHSLAQIEVAAGRAAELARQLLAFSGRGRFAVQPVDLDEVVQQTVEVVRSRAPVGVQLRVEPGGDLPAISADPVQAGQVVLNLVINAIDAMGSRSGDVVIRTQRFTADAAWVGAARVGEDAAPGDYVALLVQDSGCGMSDAVQARIFEPFYSTKTVGRGLGLAAVQGIVRGHGAILGLETALGEGSTFTVLWPPAEGSAAQPEPAQAAAPVTGCTGVVLVVDDQAAVRDLAERVLGRAGYEVLTAPSGNDAVALLDTTDVAVDAVVLDLTMPGLSGEQTFRLLRERRPDLPVLLSSGYDETEARAAFGCPRGVDFLRKPYRSSQLVAAIERLLPGSCPVRADPQQPR